MKVMLSQSLDLLLRHLLFAGNNASLLALSVLVLVVLLLLVAIMSIVVMLRARNGRLLPTTCPLSSSSMPANSS
jgi:hypothetical protein